jgi:hypothetical protein
MLKTEDYELMIVEGAGDDGRFADAVDGLLGHLLSGIPGYSARATDGVILHYSRISEVEVISGGIAVMIADQIVEPIELRFVLDRSTKSISSGWVNFGNSENARPIKYGSREHRKLQDEINVRGSASYCWKERFQRDGGGWHRG